MDGYYCSKKILCRELKNVWLFKTLKHLKPIFLNENLFNRSVLLIRTLNWPVCDHTVYTFTYFALSYTYSRVFFYRVASLLVAISYLYSLKGLSCWNRMELVGTKGGLVCAENPRNQHWCLKYLNTYFLTNFVIFNSLLLIL